MRQPTYSASTRPCVKGAKKIGKRIPLRLKPKVQVHMLISEQTSGIAGPYAAATRRIYGLHSLLRHLQF